MNVNLIRYWDIENCPDQPATDYTIEVSLKDGRRYNVVTSYHWGDGNPESDDHALVLAHTLECRVKSWSFAREDEHFSYEEAEIEITERELAEIIEVGTLTSASAPYSVAEEKVY